MYLLPGVTPKHHKPGSVAVAACVVDLNGRVPAEIKLTPAGHFRARDGRPHEVPTGWYIDAGLAQGVLNRAIATVDDFVIDYEHQTLHAEKNGKPAPAGGWWKGANMQWREGDGLYATDIEWTDAAKAAIAAKEYRYISPVLVYDKTTGNVLAILMAALTNYAAVDGLSDLTAMAAARFSFTNEQPEEENHIVKREQLIAMLGLAADATEEQIKQALAALKARAESVTALRAVLAIDEQADIGAAVAALKTAAKPDMSQYVPKAVHDETRAQLAALKGAGETAEVERLIEEGVADGRIAGKATADWLRTEGLAALKAHLEDAPTIAALKGTQTAGKKPEDGKEDDELSAEEIAVCKNTGMSHEDYKAAKKASA